MQINFEGQKSDQQFPMDAVSLERKRKKVFWGACNILYLDLYDGYMGNFALQKFFEVYVLCFDKMVTKRNSEAY